jgi:hypothetical protein
MKYYNNFFKKKSDNKYKTKIEITYKKENTGKHSITVITELENTERVYHRKKDNQVLKRYYNGKQKTHTVKNTIISNTLKIVLFVGFTVLDAAHDYKLLINRISS